MKDWINRVIVFGVSGFALVILITGCTLAGAGAAPLTTPVGDIDDTGMQPTEEGGLPEPTTPPPMDVYATLTAQAQPPQPVETEETLPTGEAGGEIPPPEESPTPTPTPTPEPTEPSAGAACPATHVVQPGENLYRIALKYGLTYEKLAAANGITNPDVLPAGTVLKIPGCGGTDSGGAVTDTEPQPGDTVDEETGDILHTVQQGENLFRIALRYGVSWKALAAYNGITNPDAIRVGQIIRIPTR